MSQANQSAHHSSLITHYSLAFRIGVVTALLLTIFSIAVYLRFDGDILVFVNIGERFNLGIPDGRAGGEGQFPYYIATEGASLSAISKMDPPAAYRYQRILYPALVAALSFGQTALVPYVMLLINIAATSIFTALTAYLLAWRTRVIPWLALLVAVWMGSLICVRYNTTEPLALALSMAALVFYLRDHLAAAAVLAASAALTKDIGLVPIAGMVLHALWTRRWQRAAILALAAGVPYMGWSLLLRLWLQTGIDATQAHRQVSLIPFAGLLRSYSPVFLVLGILWAILPAALLGIIALRQCWRSRFQRDLPIELFLLLSAAAFVILVPGGTFEDLPSTLRYSQPFVIAALLYVSYRNPRRALWLLILWLPTTALALAISFIR
ncbi:MAG: hypothetical protein U0528_00235 [Anaerolineae bacterium]